MPAKEPRTPQVEKVRADARGFLDDWFNDYYKNRFRVYRMNFVRGIVFGFGSVVGGTLMITLLLWLLSFTTELPFIGHFTEVIQRSIESSTIPGRHG